MQRVRQVIVKKGLITDGQSNRAATDCSVGYASSLEGMRDAGGDALRFVAQLGNASVCSGEKPALHLLQSSYCSHKVTEAFGSEPSFEGDKPVGGGR